MSKIAIMLGFITGAVSCLAFTAPALAPDQVRWWFTPAWILFAVLSVGFFRASWRHYNHERKSAARNRHAQKVGGRWLRE